MSAPEKRSTADTLRALEAMADDDAAEREMDRILALKPEEVDRELAAAGIDPAAARARGAKLAREAGLTPGKVGPASRPRRVVRAVVLLLAAALAVALLVWSQKPPGGAHAPPPPPKQLPR